jgi:hypothetical protein
MFLPLLWFVIQVLLVVEPALQILDLPLEERQI